MNSLSPPKLSDDPPPHAHTSATTHGGAKYKLMSPARLPISRSLCITIPAGISPSSFLESPVLLSHYKVEPSPTTGSLFKPQTVYGCFGSSNYTSMEDSSNIENLDGEKSSYFQFRPLSGSNMVSEDKNYKQSQKLVQVQGQCLTQSLTSSAIVTSEATGPSNTQNLSLPVNMTASQAMAVVDNNLDDSNRTSSSSGIQDSQSDHKGAGICDDGYNWRKYGQKLVKGSEFPRSYYKCTHPNCEVKKLFERSPDGIITEIVYKGTHDHPKPQPSRRYSAGAMMPIQDKSDKALTLSCQDDKTCNVYGQMSHAIESNNTEQSPYATSDNTLGAVASQSKRIHDGVDDDDDDDQLLKHRKMDISEIDVTPIVKPIREPRVVVQTVSEVDVLDDGYRWRKYGQKVVRGNPNPRSYYKCTNAGCPVRKHVERASHDPKAVITTYEGKHNHDVPTARTSSHDAAGSVSLTGHSRIRSENSDTISLNLGVGINMAAESRSSEPPQMSHLEAIQRQIHLGTSNFKVVQAIPVSTYYGVPDSSMIYGTKGSQDESHGAGISPLNPSYPYPQNMGKILMGP